MEEDTPYPANATSPVSPQDDTNHSTAKSPLSDISGSGLTATVHALIRLIQCSCCSRPLRAPLRLPCGNTLCRSCLPPIHERTGITFPASDDRKMGFTCHWGTDNGCAGEHCLGDCGADVLLGRLVDVFDAVLCNSSASSEAPLGNECGFRVTWTGLRGDQPGTVAKSADAAGGLLEGMYDLVKCGLFDYDASDLKFEMHEPIDQENQRFERLKDAVRNELDCQVALRRDTSAQEVTALDDEAILPLFVSSLSLPTMPTFLHVFEARYRLMMQRVMQTRERRFGMVMFNRAGRFQQGLGRSQFMQYGTALGIDRYELLPDGRSLVVATGLYRFKVLSSYMLDMYYVGKIQRVDDIPVIEEENREALETSVADASDEQPLESMSTQQLFQLGLDFDGSIPTLHYVCLMTSRPSPRLCSNPGHNGTGRIIHTILVSKGFDIFHPVFHVVLCYLRLCRLVNR
ncbi:hypothetical protein BDV24DRAFT_151009 [Aspergillus arachidicola]|uniref:Lon N-terminal domain-containing protein n=1 Tax=Aspergillus arachidicola TaxID=656916 RepID=A0A5N6Y7Z7_9EURO|nr:hypothetical protein BDV24DRAFT_151009 [Aspergillus arachidicola]